MPEAVVRGVRHALGVRPVFKTVDTCAAEFAAQTPYHYSSYDEENEVAPREREAVIILGSGPNRIGQGVEFDYSCVHASFALRDAGYDTVMVNCNPETVSTDYDTSSRLYFEPLTLEDVLEVYHAEKQAGPIAGVIVQLGGQTPLGLARALKDAGVPIVGTSPEAIDLAEDRGAFGRVLAEAKLPAPQHGTAYSASEALAVAQEIGYPVLVRPSYVLGGRGMEIVYDDDTLVTYVERATDGRVRSTRCSSTASSTTPSRSTSTSSTTGPRCTSAGSWSTSRRPASTPATAPAPSRPRPSATPRSSSSARARSSSPQGIGVVGLMNVQFALAQDILYVLEANPRASRTVPFVAKATGVALANAASRIMLGATHRPAARGGRPPAQRRRWHPAAARADLGQGGRPAVPPLPPGRRHDGRQPPRTGDALDR